MHIISHYKITFPTWFDQFCAQLLISTTLVELSALRKTDNILKEIMNHCPIVKARYFKKVGLVDLSPYGGKIKFEFWLSRQRRAGRQNSNFIFPPSEPKSTRPTFIK